MAAAVTGTYFQPGHEAASGIIQTSDLFGGSRKWDEKNWTAVDDRVRGGSSQSYMTIKTPASATFNGNLDTSTLGGAGFASQRTILGPSRTSNSDNDEKDFLWDFTNYSGILLTNLSSSDEQNKNYTFNLKDEILPRDPDSGREQSSVSWEYDFTVGKDATSLMIPWKAFKATYRGREVKGKTLNLQRVRRMSLMMRSFFDKQNGDFSLDLSGIAAYRVKGAAAGIDDAEEEEDMNSVEHEKRHAQQQDEEASERRDGGLLRSLWHTVTGCVRGRL